MRVQDIIRAGERCRLRHPEIGDVLWTDEPCQGFVLVWCGGPEKGWSLAADEGVLLDNHWERVPLKEGDTEQEPPRRLAPPSELVPDPAAIASRLDLVAFIERLRSNPLDDPELWNQ